MHLLKRHKSLSRYLSSEEIVLLETRQHPFALANHVFRMLILLTPLLMMAWGIGGISFLRGSISEWIIRVLLLVGLFVIVKLAWQVIGWELERVVVTNDKVIHVSGILQRQIASTPLKKVSELTVLQSWLGRILDYGCLVVDVPGGRKQALHGLRFIPDPAGIYRLVTSGKKDKPIVKAVRWVNPWEGEQLDNESLDHTIQIPKVSE